MAELQYRVAELNQAVEELTAARNAAQQEAQDLAVKLQVGWGCGLNELVGGWVGRDRGGTGICCNYWAVPLAGTCPAYAYVPRCQRPPAASVPKLAELSWLVNGICRRVSCSLQC